MLIASHIATVPSTAAARSLRPAAWRIVVACTVGRGFSPNGKPADCTSGDCYASGSSPFGRSSFGRFDRNVDRSSGGKMRPYRCEMSKPE